MRAIAFHVRRPLVNERDNATLLVFHLNPLCLVCVDHTGKITFVYDYDWKPSQHSWHTVTENFQP